ncbi:DUF2568 domain-containing protein [Streptomyces sp. NPDC004042]|uniref:DUF2568 domain-containing protein n=1 Tax=Streptomyces sp. NPDC004042 TaxID=3154451 RepID=UPI0033AD8363
MTGNDPVDTATAPPGLRPWYASDGLLAFLAFLLELTALAALAWWDFTTGHGATRVLHGLLVKALVLGGGAAALHGTGHPAAALAMAGPVIANTTLAESFRRSRD